MGFTPQTQKAGDASTLIQAGGNVQITLGVSYADVKQIIAEERERIVQDVWERMQQMLKDAGTPPGPIRFNTLVPLLQYAALDDDAYLKERWAALLAQASIRDTQDATRVYVEVLRGLSSTDVKLLAALCKFVEGGGSTVTYKSRILGRFPYDAYSSDGLPVGSTDDVLKVFKQSVLSPVAEDAEQDNAAKILQHWRQRSAFLISLGNLNRSGLIAEKVQPALPIAVTVDLPHAIEALQPVYYVTPFGFEFTAACTPPSPAKEP